MTDANTIREAIRSTYKARIRGDLEGTVALFADDAVFDFNGEGVGLPNMAAAVRGKPAIRLLMTEFIDAFRMSDWQEISLVVEGDKAALHWRGTVTFTQNGRSDTFDVVDLLTFRDGKIVYFRQSTDTAKIRAMLGP
jgi:ketosteroid isomerase-like protein